MHTTRFYRITFIRYTQIHYIGKTNNFKVFVRKKYVLLKMRDITEILLKVALKDKNP
jgi:hypothetical protein